MSSVNKSVGSSVYPAVHNPLRVPSALIGAGGPVVLPPFNQHFLVDDLGNFIVDDSNFRVTCFLNTFITIAVRDGANAPRDLVAADITTIGYWQIYDNIRATPGPIYFTPVNVAQSDPWVSGGIWSSGGNLRIYLPISALVGDPDAIEIEIVPASGVATIVQPVQEV